MYRLIKTIGFLSPFVWLKAAVAHAQLSASETTLTEIGDETDLTVTSLPVLVGNIINIVLGLLGIVLVVLLIYGGFLWMTAGGGTEQIGKAKKIIFNSIIGLVITVAAYAIASFVIANIITAAAS